MFKVYGIIEISKIEFFNFSGAESVKGLSVAIILSGLRVRLWAFNLIQRQPSGGVLKKRCSENMQQNYRVTPMQKCDFKKVALLCNFIEIALRGMGALLQVCGIYSEHLFLRTRLNSSFCWLLVRFCVWREKECKPPEPNVLEALIFWPGEKKAFFIWRSTKIKPLFFQTFT